MVQYLFYGEEPQISIKVVYYGPGMSGKTTNLEVIFRDVPRINRGELAQVNTDKDRTLFFDFLPVFVGNVNVMDPKTQQYRDMAVKLRLFTVPGQSFYSSTRKLILKDTDGVVFVADSQRKKFGENGESLRDLHSNLKEAGVPPENIPLVFQWNKRDLPNVSPLEELRRLNVTNSPEFEAIAVRKQGVFPTIKKCTELIMQKLKGKK